MGVNSASITGACLADFQGGASNDGLYLACCSTRSRIGPPQGFTQGAVLAERVTERGRKACQVLPREVTITHPGSSAPSMINYPRGPRSSASSSPYEPRGGTQHTSHTVRKAGAKMATINYTISNYQIAIVRRNSKVHHQCDKCVELRTHGGAAALPCTLAHRVENLSVRASSY